MPYCPTCNGEYRRGKTHCPECNVPLVDEPWEHSAAAALGAEPGVGAEPEFAVICETDSPVLHSPTYAPNFSPMRFAGHFRAGR